VEGGARTHDIQPSKDESMRVTDIYIQRDFVMKNKANEKVMDYVFGDILMKPLDLLTPRVSCCFLIWGMRKIA